MIDIDGALFTPIASAVREAYPGAFVSSEYVARPPAFPAVSIEVTSNVALRDTQTSGSMENDAEVVCEVNVYSNREKGKKAEARAIISLIDGLMPLNFTRSYYGTIPNLNDATIYRMTARYRAIVSKDLVVYRR